MPVTYQDPTQKKIVRQPLVKRIRAYYRSARKTATENLFYQKIYMDINRLHLELELINTKIFNRVKSIIGAETSNAHKVDDNQDSSYFGAKYHDLTGDSVAFFYSNEDATPSITDGKANLYTTSSVAAKLANLNFKINQLERRVR